MTTYDNSEPLPDWHVDPVRTQRSNDTERAHDPFDWYMSTVQEDVLRHGLSVPENVQLGEN